MTHADQQTIARELNRIWNVIRDTIECDVYVNGPRCSGHKVQQSVADNLTCYGSIEVRVLYGNLTLLEKQAVLNFTFPASVY